MFANRSRAWDNGVGGSEGPGTGKVFEMRQSFDDWLVEVDRVVSGRVGLGVSDLEDCAYRDWYEDGVRAATAATRAIRNAGGEF